MTAVELAKVVRLGCILTVESTTECPDGVDVKCAEKREVKDFAG